MAIDDQAYKDALKAIEAGEIPEDLDLPDPEDYDDMGGIKSLDRGAPSIKMASETAEEELQLELGTVYEEFLDAVKEGFQGSFDDYARQYFTRKKAMQDRQMAMNGGRMQYGEGTPDKRGNPAVMTEIEALLQGIRPKNNKKPDPMGNPAVMTEIENMREFKRMNPDVEDVTDYKTKYLKLKAQDEEIKRMLKKAEEDKVKRAKGGIAGVL